MNNEIKEKLECLRAISDGGCVWPVYQHEAKILLDYITNLQEENEDLREENKEAHDFDETMKDIKDNLIARINRQECEIHNLKANLEMYENGVYFSSENDELQERIDKAIKFIKENTERALVNGNSEELIDQEDIPILLNILQGNKWNEVERAYLDDKPIGGEKE